MLNVNDADLNTVLFKNIPTIPFVTGIGEVTNPTRVEHDRKLPESRPDVYKYPIQCSGGFLRIRLFDTMGKKLPHSRKG